MITKEDITKLAKLARVEVTEGEKEKLAKDVSGILGYVDQIKNAIGKTEGERKIPDLRNVAREDANANATGMNTEAIVREFPKSDKNYLAVKKIIEQ